MEPHKSFKGSFLYDVTSTGDGVVAVGCRGDFHCRQGRVWTSKDGLDWKLSQKVPMAPFAVAANGDMLAAGGIDDAVTLGVGRAVIVTKGESGWGITDALGKRKSQVNGAAAYGDGVVMAGWQWRANADAPKSALFVSPGGQTWDVVSPGALKGFSASDVDASGDLILVGGVRFDTALGSSTPVALWTRDLEAFERAEFPDDLSADLDLTGIAISDDGAMAFATGHEGYRPVIWYSELE